MSFDPRDVSWILVRNDRDWIGPGPRQGDITITVDGQYAGIAAMGETKTIDVYPGAHTLRVRARVGLWVFLSPRVQVEVYPGATIYFRADIPRHLNAARRMAKMAFHPFRSLVLEPTEDHVSPAQGR